MGAQANAPPLPQTLCPCLTTTISIPKVVQYINRKESADTSFETHSF